MNEVPSPRALCVFRQSKSIFPKLCPTDDTLTTLLGSHSFSRSNNRLVNRKWPMWLTPNIIPSPSSVRPCRKTPVTTSRRNLNALSRHCKIKTNKDGNHLDTLESQEQSTLSWFQRTRRSYTSCVMYLLNWLWPISVQIGQHMKKTKILPLWFPAPERDSILHNPRGPKSAELPARIISVYCNLGLIFKALA